MTRKTFDPKRKIGWRSTTRGWCWMAYVWQIERVVLSRHIHQFELWRGSRCLGSFPTVAAAMDHADTVA